MDIMVVPITKKPVMCVRDKRKRPFLHCSRIYIMPLVNLLRMLANFMIFSREKLYRIILVQNSLGFFTPKLSTNYIQNKYMLIKQL